MGITAAGLVSLLSRAKFSSIPGWAAYVEWTKRLGPERTQTAREKCVFAVYAAHHYCQFGLFDTWVMEMQRAYCSEFLVPAA